MGVPETFQRKSSCFPTLLANLIRPHRLGTQRRGNRAESLGVKILNMGFESAEQKFNRLRGQSQKLVLTSYPNPERNGCPGDAVVRDYAERVANWESVEEEVAYHHITHCSPCYREFLDMGEKIRASRDQKPAKRIPWSFRRSMSRTLDQLEDVMKSARDEVARDVASRLSRTHR